MPQLDDITGVIVDAAVHLHMRIGPGLLESVYNVLLAQELARRGLSVERQCPARFEIDGLVFTNGFRIDLLVEGLVVVELKSVEQLAPVHWKQVLTYLRLLDLPLGLLINFGAYSLKDGLHRVANPYRLSGQGPARRKPRCSRPRPPSSADSGSSGRPIPPM